MRPRRDHDRQAENANLEAHQRAADPPTRNAIAVKAPAITWLTRLTPPNNAAKSTEPPMTATPIVKCHTLFGAKCRGSTQLKSTYASTKDNRSSAPNANISTRPPSIISVTAWD